MMAGKQPTLREVAALAGVSVATVSHVINKTKSVSGGTEAAVRSAIAALDFQSNTAAQALKGKRTKTIGVMVPSIKNSFYACVLSGIEDVLKAEGYFLFVVNTNENAQDEISAIRMFNARRVDGLIVAPIDRAFGKAARPLQNYPVVCIDRKPDDKSIHTVSIDNYAITRQAVQALIDRGRRRIGIVIGLDYVSPSQDRLQAYLDVLRENGIAPNPDYIQVGGSDNSAAYGIARYLVEETNVDAIYVSNSVMTPYVLRYMIQNHIDVPGRIALIGLDDYNWSDLTAPPLTMIHMPVIDIGTQAARLILENIEEADMAPQHIQLEAQLIIRASI